MEETKKTEIECLFEQLGLDYFKEMPEEAREKMIRTIIYMMIS